MFITGLGTAAPANRYSQRECWEAVRESPQWGALSARSRAILRKVLTGENGIATRCLSYDRLGEAFDLKPDTLHARFARNAPLLAEQAAARAMADAGVEPQTIDVLVISTCTGYLCPGLSSYVSERLGLRADTLALDLVGQGCVAALPNLSTTESLLASGRAKRALSVCVEVCSAALYFDDDPGVLISACIFGDGAGAAVLECGPALAQEFRPGKMQSAGRPSPGCFGPASCRMESESESRTVRKRRVEWKARGSLLAPEHRGLLRFEQRQGMLRNILSPQVPALASQHAAALLGTVLRAANVPRSAVTGWMLHPGGRDVLLALGEQMGLKDGDLRFSFEVLRNFGNVSSASLYFVLQAALADSAPNGWWWMSSFGAGFSCHGALLRVG